MWQVVVVICGLSGCETAAMRAPYATLEECRDAGRRLMPALVQAAGAYVATRGIQRPMVDVRCDVPPARA